MRVFLLKDLTFQNPYYGKRYNSTLGDVRERKAKKSRRQQHHCIQATRGKALCLIYLSVLELEFSCVMVVMETYINIFIWAEKSSRIFTDRRKSDLEDKFKVDD